MALPITELFYRDDVSKDITSISCGNVWLWFYREALVAVTHVVPATGIVEAVMVKKPSRPPIAYKSYAEWIAHFKVEAEKIAENCAITVSEFTDVNSEEIQAAALRWIGNQISNIVQDKITGSID